MTFFVNDQPSIRRVEGRTVVRAIGANGDDSGAHTLRAVLLRKPSGIRSEDLGQLAIRAADSIVLCEAPPHRRGFHRPCVVRRVRRSCSPTECADLGIMRRAVRARIPLAHHNAK